MSAMFRLCIGLILVTLTHCNETNSYSVSETTETCKKGSLEVIMEELDAMKGPVAEVIKHINAITAEFIDRRADNMWHLGMNMNPEDGHIMGYMTGWVDGTAVGTRSTALTTDFLDKTTWNLPVHYIAIVRHQNGISDAIKVWKFTFLGKSMLERFQDARNDEKSVIAATTGGPLQVNIAKYAQNIHTDPIFGLDGELVLNYRNGDNGCRILMSTSYFPTEKGGSNARGLGNQFSLLDDTHVKESRWAHEISNIQDCQATGCSMVDVQGTDHGDGETLKTGPVYGSYAVYVSADATRFPVLESSLGVEMDPLYYLQ